MKSQWLPASSWLAVLSVALTAAASSSQKAAMDAAIEQVLGSHFNTTILHVEHFEAGQLMLSSHPTDGSQPIIPTAKNGATVVKLFIRTNGDAPPQPNPDAGTDVGIEFWFPDPDAWSGRVVNFILGGWQGNPRVTDPLYSDVAGSAEYQLGEWATEFGFVSAHSDGGHSTSLDPLFPGYEGTLDTAYLLTADGERNYEGWKNIAWQATHLMAVTSKELARAYYGQAANASYIVGCSTGGRQVYQVAEDIPEDYDGILAIAPSFQGSLYYGSIGYSTIVVNNALKDDPFSQEQPEVVSQKALAAGDTAITGSHDGYVTNWQNNRYDPTKDASILRVEDGGNCTAPWAISLTQAQALNKVWYGATKDGTAPDPAEDNGASLELSGNRLYYGKQRGIRLSFMTTEQPSEVPGIFWPVAYLNESLGEPRYFTNGENAWTNFSYATFAKYMEGGPALDAEFINMDAINPDLAAFQQRGGKLLTYHGIADYYSPIQHTAHYFERSLNYTGGLESALDFHRVFFVPGMTHCSFLPRQAGYATIPFPSFKTVFDQLVSWTEADEAPAELLASTPNGSKSRPICPYPRLPRYDGVGDVNLASSFTC